MQLTVVIGRAVYETYDDSVAPLIEVIKHLIMHKVPATGYDLYGW